MKKIKTILGILITLVLAFSMSFTVMASDTKTATYRVVFYDENGTQLKEDFREGTVGDTVSADVDDFYAFDDYDFDPSNVNCVMDTVVKEDGTSQLAIYFKAKSDAGKVVYTVKWLYGTNLLKSEERKAEPNTTVSIIGVDTDAIEVDSTTYNFDMENSDNVFSTEVKEDGTSELKIYMKPMTDTTVNPPVTTGKKAIYTILWLTSEGKEIKRDIREGVVGELASIDPNDLAAFDKYVFDMDNDAQITKVDKLTEDGLTELKLYFKVQNEDNKDSSGNTQNTSGTSTKDNSGDTLKESEANKTSKPVFTPVVNNSKETNATTQTPKVETVNEKPQIIESVQTGDTTPLTICLFAMFLSIGVITMTILKRKKHSRR